MKKSVASLEEAMQKSGLYACIYKGETKGKKVYSLYLREVIQNPDGPVPHIGYPFVYVKGKGGGEVITGDEVFEWLNPFNKEEEDRDGLLDE